ncbi:hypothetical protein I4F81_002420 [Pyropia yezoensis]|uniref:Uncharacterized protein n=1 Tax=Pyropia yezoensis TaxID=2788 RepID=A0ACC3BQ06_PYRYE|nr:hypothetical protein I4F81_002420 [Neopyropia yezoensis]
MERKALHELSKPPLSSPKHSWTSRTFGSGTAPGLSCPSNADTALISLPSGPRVARSRKSPPASRSSISPCTAARGVTRKAPAPSDITWFRSSAWASARSRRSTSRLARPLVAPPLKRRTRCHSVLLMLLSRTNCVCSRAERGARAAAAGATTTPPLWRARRHKSFTAAMRKPCSTPSTLLAAAATSAALHRFWRGPTSTLRGMV